MTENHFLRIIWGLSFQNPQGYTPYSINAEFSVFPEVKVLQVKKKKKISHPGHEVNKEYKSDSFELNIVPETYYFAV